jgi:NitT/TauT family transport system substrate-binding protein
MTKQFSRRAFAGLAASVALAVSLSGCGGSADGSAAVGSSAASSGAASGSTGAVDKINLLVAPVAYEPVYIAQDQGIFAKHGLQVNFVDGGTAAQAIPQLLSGKVDIAATGGVSLIAAVAQGIPVQAIAGSLGADPKIVTSGILVKQDSPIHDYKDLQGKTVGLQGLKETTNLGTMLGVEAHGGDPKSVNFVQLPLPSLNDAVLKGQVDAVYNIGSFYPAGLAQGLRAIGAPANEYMANGSSALWFTTKTYIGKNKRVIGEFQAAMEEATKYALANHDAVVQQEIKHSQQDPNYLKNAPAQPLEWRIDRKGMQATIDGMAKYKFINSKPSFNDVVWTGTPLTGK